MKMCLPPYYSLGGGTFGGGTLGSSVPGSTQSGGMPTTISGAAGGSNEGAPRVPGAASDSASGNQTSTAGCSVVRGSNTGASGLALLALGLFGFARRRRSERAARSAR